MIAMLIAYFVLEYLLLRYELVRKYLKEGMSAIESLRKAYEDVYGLIN